MSFMITLYVREGIVMAADSRLTLNTQEKKDDKTIMNTDVAVSDTNYKLFLSPDSIGIATSGAADIQGVPIAGYVDSFIATKSQNSTGNINDFAQELLDYFKGFEVVPQTIFHVAGYNNSNSEIKQEVWHVDVASDEIKQLNPTGHQGASWGGESDILSRIVQPVAQLDQNGEIQRKIPHFQIPWQVFTLQDAIDFAVFAVRSTIDAFRFQPRAKTVGGPIDVLVINPQEAKWIQRKELRYPK